MSTLSQIKRLALEANISPACADDVLYLRSRNRWTQALEDRLIALHKAGTPPIITEFGVTPETQAALMKEVDEALRNRG